MKTKQELIKRLKGFRGTCRNRLLLLKDKTLTIKEFVVYEASLDLADWDKENHPNYYGSFDLTWEDIGFYLGCKFSSISRSAKKLFTLGLWEKRNDGRIQVKGVELTDIKLLTQLIKKDPRPDILTCIAKTQTSFAKTQREVAEMQTDFPKAEGVNQAQNLAKTQSVESKLNIVSFKNEVSISPEEERELEEYREQKWGEEALCFCKSGAKFLDCCRVLIHKTIAESTPCEVF